MVVRGLGGRRGRVEVKMYEEDRAEDPVENREAVEAGEKKVAGVYECGQQIEKLAEGRKAVEAEEKVARVYERGQQEHVGHRDHGYSNRRYI